MSLQANIDHLAIASGIEAVVVDSGSRDRRGAESWYPVLDGSLDLFKRTEEKSIRLVVGKHTIVVQQENAETVAVVLPTGHAIAKSLRRMIRRMSRKDRGPLPRAKQALVTGAPATSAPATGAPATGAPLTGAPPTAPSGGQSTPPSSGQPTVAPVTKPEDVKSTPALPAPSTEHTERTERQNRTTF